MTKILRGRSCGEPYTVGNAERRSPEMLHRQPRDSTPGQPEAEDDPAVRAAAREAEIAWREAAMRAQLRPGEVIPFLKARPDTCYSCGESSRIRGARCDLCFAAAGRVMPLDVLVRTQRRR